MTDIFKELTNINTSELIEKKQMVATIDRILKNYGYVIVGIDDERPWGAFLKLRDEDAEKFISDFFPDLTLNDAKLGNDQAQLSPKILIVSPKKRLSWQYHNRRAERWTFVTNGRLEKSMTDQSQGVTSINSADSVQFSPFERHRLVGREGAYTIVAEIWQHTDKTNLSDEEDIVRLADDYQRDKIVDKLTAINKGGMA